jgi:predicted AlkP superfamily pyrophosphatase or phosphodiesterase
MVLSIYWKKQIDVRRGVTLRAKTDSTTFICTITRTYCQTRLQFSLSKYVVMQSISHNLGTPNEQLPQLIDRIDRFFSTNYVEGEEMFCELDSL